MRKYVSYKFHKNHLKDLLAQDKGVALIPYPMQANCLFLIIFYLIKRLQNPITTPITKIPNGNKNKEEKSGIFKGSTLGKAVKKSIAIFVKISVISGLKSKEKESKSNKSPKKKIK